MYINIYKINVYYSMLYIHLRRSELIHMHCIEYLTDVKGQIDLSGCSCCVILCQWNGRICNRWCVLMNKILFLVSESIVLTEMKMSKSGIVVFV